MLRELDQVTPGSSPTDQATSESTVADATTQVAAPETPSQEPAESAAPSATELDYDRLLDDDGLIERLSNDHRFLNNRRVRDAIYGRAGQLAPEIAEKLAADRLRAQQAELAAARERGERVRSIQESDPTELGLKVKEQAVLDEQVLHLRNQIEPEIKGRLEADYANRELSRLNAVLSELTEGLSPAEHKDIWDRTRSGALSNFTEVREAIVAFRQKASEGQTVAEVRKQLEAAAQETAKRIEQELRAKLRLTEDRPDMSDGTPPSGPISLEELQKMTPAQFTAREAELKAMIGMT